MVERRAVYLGVDVGTTATKAIAFDERGDPLASGAAGYPTHRTRTDHAEQDALDWLHAVESSVADVAAQVGLGGVHGIGVTSQVDTHVLVDEELTPLRPALLWQDVRTASTAAALNAELGPQGRHDGWGDSRPLDASNPVVRARWFAEHEPSTWASSRWVQLPKDFITAQLTGVVGADPLGSFKVVSAAARYVPGVAHAPGLGDRLAPLSSPEHPLGATLVDWHGIPAGTTVATGSMDAVGNILGSGLRRAGDSMLVVGTSVIVAALGRGGTSGPGVVNFAPYLGRQVHAGPTQSGGDSLRWWAAASGHSIADVLAAAATARAGSGGVVFAPHLMGERAPLWDDEVRGWFTGIHSGTGFAELSRAVLEGVACSARELFDAVEVAADVPLHRIVLSGGGSRSELWCQILADVLGRTMYRSREVDTAVVGAAALAAAASAGTDPWMQATELAQHDLLLEPDPAVRDRHDGLHAVYLDTYTALREVHRTLRDVPSRDAVHDPSTGIT